MTEMELTPGQSVKVATKELLVCVKVATKELLVADASKSGPDACDWTVGRTATGWRVVIEPQWWVHASDFCFVRFGFAGPSPVSLQNAIDATRHSPPIPAQLPPATRLRRTIWAWSLNH